MSSQFNDAKEPTGEDRARPAAASFVWYELMTTDMEAATRFYSSVAGWEAVAADLPGDPYNFLKADGHGVAGLMTLPAAAADAGARPGWIGYVGVADVDAAARKLADAGGAIHYGPDDIPQVGRFATVADPGGATFALFAPLEPNEAPAPPPETLGHVGWHELYAMPSGDAALAFYEEQFGWTRDGDMDMGPMGKYRFFATGGAMVGGIMDKPAEVPMSAWQFYFVVDAIDAAVGRIRDGGGQVLQEPTEVPGGSWIVTGVDPQGAHFALTAARR